MSSSTSTRSKAASLAFLQAFVVGLQKHLANQSFLVGTTTFTAASLVQLLGSLIAAIEAVNAVQVQAKNAVANLRAVKATVSPVVSAVARVVAAMFASDAAVLADFGLKPHKAPAPRTTEQKAAAKAKAEATRIARGTKGPKAKKAIKGNVTGVDITPITAPVAPEPATAQPAANPSSTPITGVSK